MNFVGFGYQYINSLYILPDKKGQKQQLNKPYCTYGSEVAGCLTNCNNNQLTTLPYTQMETISDFCSSLFSAKYPWKFSRLPLLMKIELSTFEFVNHARSNAYIVVAAIVFIIYMKHITLVYNLKIQQTTANIIQCITDS